MSYLHSTKFVICDTWLYFNSQVFFIYLVLNISICNWLHFLLKFLYWNFSSVFILFVTSKILELKRQQILTTRLSISGAWSLNIPYFHLCIYTLYILYIHNTYIFRFISSFVTIYSFSIILSECVSVCLSVCLSVDHFFSPSWLFLLLLHNM